MTYLVTIIRRSHLYTRVDAASPEDARTKGQQIIEAGYPNDEAEWVGELDDQIVDIQTGD